jgi:hypothetical protein
MNGDARLRHWFHPLLISAMIGCIAVAAADLMRFANPAWSRAYFVAGCVLAALEASHSYRVIKARDLRWGELRRFRSAEILTLLILLKIGSFVGDSWGSVLAEIAAWPSQPLRILDPETTIASLLALTSWLLSTLTIRDLERLDDPPEYYLDQPPPGEAIASRFLGGGAMLLAIVGVTRWILESPLNQGRTLLSRLALNVLIYFLLGFVLLGQVRYTTLRRQWRSHETKVSEKLTGRWVRCSFILLGLAAIAALLLPTGYTMGLLEAVASLLGLFEYIAQLVVLLVAIAAWLLTFLLPPGGEMPPLPLEPEDAEITLPAVANWIEVLRSLLFWAVALGAAFYVAHNYLRDYPEILRALLSLGPIRALRALLVGIWRRLTGLATAIGERVPRRLSLRRHVGTQQLREPFRFLRLGALSPRERTLYYFLSILRRAGRQGFPRRCSQTPYEYDATLEPHLPFAQQEMDALTQAFVETRYSAHAFDREREKQVRVHWKRVKEAVRALKRGG